MGRRRKVVTIIMMQKEICMQEIRMQKIDYHALMLKSIKECKVPNFSDWCFAMAVLSYPKSGKLACTEYRASLPYTWQIREDLANVMKYYHQMVSMAEAQIGRRRAKIWRIYNAAVRRIKHLDNEAASRVIIRAVRQMKEV